MFFVDGGCGCPPETRYLPTLSLQEQERISGTWDAQLFRKVYFIEAKSLGMRCSHPKSTDETEPGK